MMLAFTWLGNFLHRELKNKSVGNQTPTFYATGRYFSHSDNKIAGDLCAPIFSGAYVLLTYHELENETWTGEGGELWKGRVHRVP